MSRPRCTICGDARGYWADHTTGRRVRESGGWDVYDDSGERVDDDPNYIQSWVTCECELERRRHARVKRAQTALPPSLRHVGFDRFPVIEMDRAQVELARSWAEAWSPETSRGLWLTGPCGTGKSTLAAACALTVGDKGATVGFWNFTDLLMRIRSTSFDRDAETSDIGWLHELAAVDVLVLDDLGAEKVSEWVFNMAYRILGMREEAGGPVIATTNLAKEELREHLGHRVVSRLHAVAGIEIPCVGPDWREENAHNAAA